MIELSLKVPRKITVACSGGVDSMVAIDFFLRGKKEVTVAHYNHSTNYADEAQYFVEKFCKERKLNLKVGKISRQKKPTESPEEFWRNNRLKWLHSLKGPVVTGHHLNDVVEWWVFSSFHGIPKLIPVKNKNIIRPFLLTPKKEILDWAIRKEVSYLDDPSNKNLRYSRNRIRHSLMPEILNINPGIHTMVKKRLKNDIAKRNIRGMPVC